MSRSGLALRRRPRCRIGGVDDTLLLAARALVLADLQARHRATPDAVDALEDACANRGWWAEQWPEGEVYVAGLVAQDVQDALFETRRALADVPGLRPGAARALALHRARHRRPVAAVGVRGVGPDRSRRSASSADVGRTRSASGAERQRDSTR